MKDSNDVLIEWYDDTNTIVTPDGVTIEYKLMKNTSTGNFVGEVVNFNLGCNFGIISQGNSIPELEYNLRDALKLALTHIIRCIESVDNQKDGAKL